MFGWMSNARPKNIDAGEITELQVQPLFGDNKILLETDGEIAGVLPARYKVVPDAVNFIIPQF